MAGLQAFVAFSEAARHGGFAGAARELGVSPSAVAKNVARLESDLGLRLFHRTTRKVALTSEGHELFERCRRIVEEIDALRDDAAGARAEPVGRLRLNVPIAFGKRVIVPKLADLVRCHPGIVLDVSFTDRYADIVSEGLDAAIRVGPLADSSLVARPFARHVLIVCGSPAYLRSHGVPRSADALAKHRCLVARLPTSKRLRPWTLTRDGTRFDLEPPPAAVFDDGEAIVAAAVASMGLAQVPDYMAADAIRRGEVVEVLKRHRPPPLQVAIVYPSARRVTPRLKALVDVLTG
jgi:DNA-binding transcriptional LysR family regulator